MNQKILICAIFVLIFCNNSSSKETFTPLENSLTGFTGKDIIGIKGEINTSLWDTMINHGISPKVILDFADIFAWQIDFLTECRDDDFCRLILKKSNGSYEILAAQYNGRETGTHTAIKFKDEYYDIKGDSLKKFFLKAPLNFRRISSYFSYRRFHPILKYYRPHLAVDYAAPSGTPAVSVGDGTVIYKGWKGQTGKVVIVKHNSIYTTTYGHLSRFDKKIKKGKFVKQNQIIGYVGATGLATGPHLDFRISKYGKPVNFLKLKFPPNIKIDKKDIPEFKNIKKDLLIKLADLNFKK